MTVRVKMRVCPCRYDHGVRMYAYMAVRIPVKTYAQKVPATPQSQVCRICWTWLALNLRRCDAGSGRLIVRVGWGFAAPDAGLSEIKVGFLELGGCMGSPPETYGKRGPYVDPRCVGIARHDNSVWPARWGLRTLSFLIQMGGAAWVWSGGTPERMENQRTWPSGRDLWTWQKSKRDAWSY